MYCFFDPKKEYICIFPLTPVDKPNIMESMVSVSALIEGEGVAPHQLSLYRKGF